VAPKKKPTVQSAFLSKRVTATTSTGRTPSEQAKYNRGGMKRIIDKYNRGPKTTSAEREALGYRIPSLSSQATSSTERGGSGGGGRIIGKTYNVRTANDAISRLEWTAQGWKKPTRRRSRGGSGSGGGGWEVGMRQETSPTERYYRQRQILERMGAVSGMGNVGGGMDRDAFAFSAARQGEWDRKSDPRFLLNKALWGTMQKQALLKEATLSMKLAQIWAKLPDSQKMNMPLKLRHEIEGLRGIMLNQMAARRGR